MKLSTSTGDFTYYADTAPEKVALFKETKFKYLNIGIPAFYSEDDGEWRAFVSKCKKAAEYAGVRYIMSHAPCLHNAVIEALTDKSNAAYRENAVALRHAVEITAELGIDRIVVHASTHPDFTKESFFEYNKMFYGELWEVAEKYNVKILTENWDNDASLFSTGSQMRELIDYINHPLFGACWDTAHGNIAKNSRVIGQYKSIVALGDRLWGLHIADNFGNCHHHTWPFAGVINFDQVMQGLIDVGYDGYFNFEACYTLLHHKNMPVRRQPWEYFGEPRTTLLDPSVALKQEAVNLLYSTGKYILEAYGCYEE